MTNNDDKKGIDRFSFELESTEITLSNARTIVNKFKTLCEGLDENITRISYDKEIAEKNIKKLSEHFKKEFTYDDTGLVFINRDSAYCNPMEQMYNIIEALENIKEYLIWKNDTSEIILDKIIKSTENLEGLKIRQVVLETQKEAFTELKAILETNNAMHRELDDSRLKNYIENDRVKTEMFKNTLEFMALQFSGKELKLENTKKKENEKEINAHEEEKEPEEMTKKQRILEIHAKHPELDYREIAKQVGASEPYTFNTLRDIK